MMHMTLYWGKEVTLLVDSWQTTSWLSYALSLVACLVAAMFYQYVENRRRCLKRVYSVSATSVASPTSIGEPLLQIKRSSGKVWTIRVAEAVMFAVSAGIGYLLMLAIMSFNGGVLVAVILGLAVGYLFFSGSDENLIPVDSNPCACA